MTPVWSDAEQRRIAAIGRILISPGEYGSIAEWQHEAATRLRTLAGADVAVFILPALLPGPYLSATGAGFDQIHNADYLLKDSEGMRRMQALRSRSWTKAMVVGDEWRAYQDSDEFQEFFYPNRFIDGAGLVSVGRDEPPAALALFSENDGRLSREDGLVRTLELLGPSFTAGVAKACLLATASLPMILDNGLGRPSMVFEPNGRLTTMSEAAVELIAGDPEGAQLMYAARELARDVGGHPADAREPKSSVNRGPLPRVRRIQVTARAAYRLSATLFTAPGAWTRQVFISIETVPPVPLSESELVSVYRLTPAHVRTALLFRDGVSVRKIAERLNISQRTAEQHMEDTKKKLGVRTQREMLSVLKGERRYRAGAAPATS
jgi:DNA-binding CsgD family transcriptional regulator